MEQDKVKTTDAGGIENVDNNAASKDVVFKAFATEDEYKREIQSERSKAKGEILKELGAEKVDDIRARISSIDTIKSEYEQKLTEMQSKYDELTAEKEQRERDSLLTSLSVDAEKKTDFMLLVEKEDGKDFKEKAEKVLERLPFFKTKTDIKTGVEKNTGAPTRRAGAFNPDQIIR